MAISNNKKLIMSIIGGIIFHFGVGAIFPLGIFSIYLVSYHREKETWLTVDYGYFFSPVITLFLTVSVSFGGYVDARLGIYKCLSIGTGIAFVGCIILYFSEYIAFTYISMAIMGIGFGLCLAAPVKNACLFDPRKKGIISSLIASIGHISTSLFYVVGEFFINPDAKPLPEGKKYYEMDVAQNVKRYYVFMAIVVPAFTIIGMLFTYQYKQEEQVQEQQEQVQEQQEQKEDKLLGNDEEKKEEDNVTVDKTSEITNSNQSSYSTSYSHELKQAFKSKRLWINASITFFTAFLIMLHLNTFKTIGTLNEISIPLLTATATFAGIGIVLFGPVWGFISDYLSFNVLIIIITSVCIFIGITLGFTLQYKYHIGFCLLTAVGVICVAGLMNIMNPHVMKVFGIKYLMQLGGIINISHGIANCLGSVFAFVISRVCTNQNVGYYILYGVGGLFNLIALLLSFLESDDEFFATHLIDSVSRIITQRPSLMTVTDAGNVTQDKIEEETKGGEEKKEEEEKKEVDIENK